MRGRRALPLSRRAALAAGSALAIGAVGRAGPAQAQGKVFTVGFVSPQTGPLALMSKADKFVVDQMNALFAKGIEVGGKSVPLRIIQKDSQSTVERAREVATALVVEDKIDLMLVGSTPETTNPVCDVCESSKVPCISSLAPWQPWFFGRKGDPAKGFQWTYHFFWGMEEVVSNYLAGWKSIETNRVVGGLFPNDADGNAFRDPELGFPKPLAADGLTLVDPGRFPPLQGDFSKQISTFIDKRVEIVTGVLLSTDAKTFLAQARKMGLRPKIITLGKALLFPAMLESLGDLGDGLTAEVWWSPKHPFTSSLTHQSAKALADAFEQTGKQWLQSVGFVHAMFEVAIDALKRAQNVGDKAALRDAIAQTRLSTVIGEVKFGGEGPFKNVCRTVLALGQWVKGTRYRFDLQIVGNTSSARIPVQSTLKSLK
jgi:branched-chain amino acid transport system substrate-binding protein